MRFAHQRKDDLADLSIGLRDILQSIVIPLRQRSDPVELPVLLLKEIKAWSHSLPPHGTLSRWRLDPLGLGLQASLQVRQELRQGPSLSGFEAIARLSFRNTLVRQNTRRLPLSMGSGQAGDQISFSSFCSSLRIP